MRLSTIPNHFGDMMDRQLQYDDTKEKSLCDIKENIENKLAVDYYKALKNNDIGEMQLAIIDVLTNTLSMLNLRIEQENIDREDFKKIVGKNFKRTLRSKLKIKKHMTKDYARVQIEYLIGKSKQETAYMDELVALLIYAGYEFKGGILAAYTAYNHKRVDADVN